jgi:hypothetical protein
MQAIQRMPQAELQSAMATLEEQLLEALVTANHVERGFDLPGFVLSVRIREIRDAARALRTSYECFQGT